MECGGLPLAAGPTGPYDRAYGELSAMSNDRHDERPQHGPGGEDDPESGPPYRGQSGDLDPESPRRIRLHPRKGSEHRYRFARRWESRRKSQPVLGLWRIIFLDAFVIVLLYLLGRQILQRITG